MNIEKHAVSLLLAAPDCAAGYRPALLDQADRRRLERKPALADRADWQSSRYLKQQTALPVLSLSHSKGAALLAASAKPCRIGVDIEHMRARDFESLAGYSCSPEERQWLAERGWQAADFYRLWTLKEALIKAAALDFPADMPNVGLAWHSDGRLKLRNCAGSQWHAISALCADWALACVWDADAGFEPEWQLFGAFAESETAVREQWPLS